MDNTATITSTIKPFKGGSYFGVHIDKKHIDPFLEELKNHLNDSVRFVNYVDNQQERDLGSYHCTVITPPEVRAIIQKYGKDSVGIANTTVSITLKGLGTVSDNKGNTAYYIVVESSEINDIREIAGLEPKDLHITIGFDGKDVHTVRKDNNTLIG